jgi:hypothetical protein
MVIGGLEPIASTPTRRMLVAMVALFASKGLCPQSPWMENVYFVYFISLTTPSVVVREVRRGQVLV